LRDADLLPTFLGGREGAVEEGDRPIELALSVERGKGGSPDALPHPLLAPPFESAPHRGGRPVLARQILPTAASNEDEEDAVDGPSVVGAGASGAGRRREERSAEDPLLVGEMNLAHAGMLCHPVTVSKPSLVQGDAPDLVAFCEPHVAVRLTRNVAW